MKRKKVVGVVVDVVVVEIIKDINRDRGFSEILMGWGFRGGRVTKFDSPCHQI